MLTTCLPNEPKLPNPEQQDLLTQHFLAPVSAQLIQLFTTLRRQLDLPLRAKQPVKLGRSYPLGQCLEISQAMWQALKQVDQSTLTKDEAQGYQALVQFVQAGGELRQVWGDLRGEYFQNALLLGSWYVDVANDTVDSNKPAVEVLPFAESGLVPVEDFFHFKRIAERYWQATVLPNIVVPSLAPYFPLIILQPNTGPQLQGLFDYMIALTRQKAFAPSAAVLNDLAFPPELFEKFRHQLVGQAPLSNVMHARAQAMNYCEHYQQQGVHQHESTRNQAVLKALECNRHWQAMVHIAP